jgi:hypothetical protein
MRIGSVLLVVWLIVGAIAAGQRHEFSRAPAGCSQVGTSPSRSSPGRSTTSV